MNEAITHDRLYQAMLYGAAKLREKRDDLNRINVFPVDDNDTGNNLAHTMSYILSHAEDRGSIRETLKDISRAALIGARGNSGAIFSQYFYGLAKKATQDDRMTLQDLADQFQDGYEAAYQALENPVEGTVITLMRVFSESFKEALGQKKSFEEAFRQALEATDAALAATAQTLEVLKKLGLVDAGALAFYHFMTGFAHALQHEDAKVSDSAKNMPLIAEDTAMHVFDDDATIPFRYCTEALIEYDRLDEKALREKLRPLGDCLLVSATDNMARLHLHTNEPWEMIRTATEHGKVLEQKADDMVWQRHLAGEQEDAIACVTDSIADLPVSFIRKHPVFPIPINILAGGTSYLDKITMTGELLQSFLPDASSAQLNTAQILEFLHPILHRYRQVLVLTVSSQMSGTHSRFQEALATLSENDRQRVALIDTKVNSGAEGLLVHRAVKMIEGGLSLDEIQKAIEQLKTKAKIVVSVIDIEPMARSGRVSERIGDLLIRLKFKPLVMIDREGKGTIKGIAFSAKRNWKLLLRSLKGKAMSDYVLVHAGAPERVENLRQAMVAQTGKEPLYITEISAVVTLFAGRGCVAAAYLEEDAASN